MSTHGLASQLVTSHTCPSNPRRCRFNIGIIYVIHASVTRSLPVHACVDHLCDDLHVSEM
jgi:hypothetical protein